MSSLQDYEAAMNSVLRTQLQLLNAANWGNNASGNAVFNAALSQNITGGAWQALCEKHAGPVCCQTWGML